MYPTPKSSFFIICLNDGIYFKVFLVIFITPLALVIADS